MSTEHNPYEHVQAGVDGPGSSDVSAEAGLATVPAGMMPPWEVAELPEPPKVEWGLRQIVGPGLMMAGAAIGGGEWLMGPAVANSFGGTVMWLALLSILAQVVYNLEVMRYALYCGEPIFVGFFRMLPGPKFWTTFYLIFDFFAVWPYLSANAAVPLVAAFLGHVPAASPVNAAPYMTAERLAAEYRIDMKLAESIKANGAKAVDMNADEPFGHDVAVRLANERSLVNWTGIGIFVVSFIPLLFGGKVYNSLVRLMTFKIVLIFAYLLFLGLFFVSFRTWAEVFGGLLFFSPDDNGAWGFRLLPSGKSWSEVDWALLGGFAAIAGQGGMNNAQFSSYCRDRGWGMGKLVGAIPSLVGGLDISLAHTGKVFRVNEGTLSQWRRWFHVLYQDQWAIWMVGCILGVAIPALISLEYLRGQNIPQDSVAAATALALSKKTGWSFFWFMTLFCGFLVMAPNQVTTTDGLVRRWTDVLWTGNKKLAQLDGTKVRFVYFALLAFYLVWGTTILWFTGSKPLNLVKISGVIMNYVLGLTAIHTLVVNCTLLPKPLRPGILARLGLIFCGVFFIGIACLGTPQALRDMGFLPKIVTVNK